jgi:hypothetical protein
MIQEIRTVLCDELGADGVIARLLSCSLLEPTRSLLKPRSN